MDILHEKVLEKMSFSEAISELSKGKKLTRTSWNGKEQYITIGIVEKFIDCDGTQEHFNKVTGKSVIIFHGSSGTQVGWLASQADMLSNDWVIK